MHIVLYWLYFTYFACFVYESHLSVFRCLFPLLLGPPSKGPDVHIPPLHPSPLFLLLSQEVPGKYADSLHMSKGIVPFSPTGTTGRRPSMDSMEVTGMTYKTCDCDCSLRS